MSALLALKRILLFRIGLDAQTKSRVTIWISWKQIKILQTLGRSNFEFFYIWYDPPSKWTFHKRSCKSNNKQQKQIKMTEGQASSLQIQIYNLHQLRQWDGDSLHERSLAAVLHEFLEPVFDGLSAAVLQDKNEQIQISLTKMFALRHV